MKINGIVNYYEAAAQFELTAEEAFEFFLQKGLSRSFRWDEMVRNEHDVAFTVAKLMNGDLLEFVKKELTKVIDSGETFKDFADKIAPALQRAGWWGKRDVLDPYSGQVIEARLGSASRLETIFRTNLQSAYAKGQWESIEENMSSMPYLMYDAVDDSRVRPEHARWDGIVLPADHSFWKTHYPPNGYNCFLPGTEIQGDIQSAMRTWYSGKAIEITTRSGRSVRVTADHPILTSRGWVKAKLIDTRDDLLSKVTPVDRDSSGGVSDNQNVTNAEDLFEALTTYALRVSEGTSLQLYSNVAKRKIHITAIDGGLAFKAQTKPAAFFKQNILIRGCNSLPFRALETVSSSLGNIRTIDPVFAQYPLNIGLGRSNQLSESCSARFLRTVGLEDFFFERIIASVGGAPCRAHLPFSTTRCLFNGLPLDDFGLRPGTDSDAILDKLSANGITTDFKLFSYLLDAHSTKVGADPVVDVREFDFSGHVYDFQSSESVVFADGILAHNCRCGVIQLSWQDLQDYGLQVSDAPNINWQTYRTPDGREITHPEGVGPTFV